MIPAKLSSELPEISTFLAGPGQVAVETTPLSAPNPDVFESPMNSMRPWRRGEGRSRAEEDGAKESPRNVTQLGTSLSSAPWEPHGNDSVMKQHARLDYAKRRVIQHATRKRRQVKRAKGATMERGNEGRWGTT